MPFFNVSQKVSNIMFNVNCVQKVLKSFSYTGNCIKNTENLTVTFDFFCQSLDI